MRLFNQKIRASAIRLAAIVTIMLFIVVLLFINHFRIVRLTFFSYTSWQGMFTRYWIALDPSIRYYFNIEPFEVVDAEIEKFVGYEMDAAGFRNWAENEAADYPLISSAFIWRKHADDLEIFPLKSPPPDSALQAVKEYLYYYLDPANNQVGQPDSVWQNEQKLRLRARKTAGYTTYQYNYHRETKSMWAAVDSVKYVFGVFWDPEYYRSNVLPLAVESFRKEYGFWDEPEMGTHWFDKKKRLLKIRGMFMTDAAGDTVLHFGETNTSQELMLNRIINVNDPDFNVLNRLPGWNLYIQNWDEPDYLISKMASEAVFHPGISLFSREFGKQYLYLFIGLGLLFCIITVGIMARRRQQIFLAHVSHELRTPVTKIRLFSETLRTDRTISSEQEKQYLDTILAESDHMSVLIDNTLNLVRMDADKMRFNKIELDTARWLTEFIHTQKIFLEESGFIVKSEIADDLPSFMADREALELAIRNLLDNAQKYSTEEKSINISARQVDNKFQIIVSDTGAGIPASERRKIFKKFYRVKSEQLQQIGGLGVGLSLVKEIVTAHKGRVRCTDNPAGKGSTFTVEIPASAKYADVK